MLNVITSHQPFSYHPFKVSLPSFFASTLGSIQARLTAANPYVWCLPISNNALSSVFVFLLKPWSHITVQPFITVSLAWMLWRVLAKNDGSQSVPLILLTFMDLYCLFRSATTVQPWQDFFEGCNIEWMMAEWLMGGYHIQHQSLPLFIGNTLRRLSGKSDCSKWVDSDSWSWFEKEEKDWW